jgi:hypothetical protein
MDISIVKQILKYANQYGNAIIALSTVAYLYVTWRILDENRKSQQGKFMPIICIDYNRREDKFIANNIGLGLGIGIEISPFRFFIKGAHVEYRLDFDKLHNLKPGETKTLSIVHKVNGEEISESSLAAHLYSEYAKRDLIFTLLVRDIIGNTYYEKVNMGKSGIFVIKLGKTWRLIRLKLFFFDKLDEMRYFCVNYYEKVRRKNASPNP